MLLWPIFLAFLAVTAARGSLSGDVRRFRGVARRESLGGRAPLPAGSLDTNAERFKRGLPPKPQKRRTLGNKRQGTTSPLPLPSYQGVITVQDTATGLPVGYVASAEKSDYFTVTVDLASALHIRLPSSTDLSSPFSIALLNSDSAYGYLGGASIYPLVGTGDPAPNSNSYGIITGSTYTAPGSEATGSNDYPDGLPSESSIWTLDSSLGLHIHYTDTNPNDITYEDSLFYNYETSFLGFSGEVSATATISPQATIDPVTFTFVPVVTF